MIARMFIITGVFLWLILPAFFYPGCILEGYEAALDSFGYLANISKDAETIDSYEYNYFSRPSEHELYKIIYFFVDSKTNWPQLLLSIITGLLLFLGIINFSMTNNENKKYNLIIALGLTILSADLWISSYQSSSNIYSSLCLLVSIIIINKPAKNKNILFILSSIIFGIGVGFRVDLLSQIAIPAFFLNKNTKNTYLSVLSLTILNAIMGICILFITGFFESTHDVSRSYKIPIHQFYLIFHLFIPQLLATSYLIFKNRKITLIKDIACFIPVMISIICIYALLGSALSETRFFCYAQITAILCTIVFFKEHSVTDIRKYFLIALLSSLIFLVINIPPFGTLKTYEAYNRHTGAQVVSPLLTLIFKTDFKMTDSILDKAIIISQKEHLPIVSVSWRNFNYLTNKNVRSSDQTLPSRKSYDNEPNTIKVNSFISKGIVNYVYLFEKGREYDQSDKFIQEVSKLKHFILSMSYDEELLTNKNYIHHCKEILPLANRSHFYEAYTVIYGCDFL